MPVSLFIGLGPRREVTEDDIYNAVSRITRVSAIRMKGSCAFCDVESMSDADRVVEKLDGIMIRETRLTVQLSHRDTKGGYRRGERRIREDSRDRRRDVSRDRYDRRDRRRDDSRERYDHYDRRDRRRDDSREKRRRREDSRDRYDRRERRRDDSRDRRDRRRDDSGDRRDYINDRRRDSSIRRHQNDRCVPSPLPISRSNTPVKTLRSVSNRSEHRSVNGSDSRSHSRSGSGEKSN